MRPEARNRQGTCNGFLYRMNPSRNLWHLRDAKITSIPEDSSPKGVLRWFGAGVFHLPMFKRLQKVRSTIHRGKDF